MGLLYGENCVILASTVFDWSTRVTDRRTDGIAMAYTRYSMLSRVKMEQLQHITLDRNFWRTLYGNVIVTLIVHNCIQ